MIDSRIQKELREKYNPDNSTLRKAQLRMLDLLSFLDAICSKYNLTYWLGAGTLLGAIRHEGFIPWDDDTDVCMPLEDMKKLKKIMGNNVYEGHIVLQSKDSDWNYLNCGWITLRDTKSEYIQDSPVHNKLRFRGLQVDIFGVEEGVPYTTRIISKIIYRGNEKFVCKFNNRFLSRQIANIISFSFEKVLSPILRVFNKKSGYYDYAIGIPFQMKQKDSVIYPLKKGLFESCYFNIPNNPENYLKNTYGNWGELPSSDKIITHNASFKFID